MRKTREQKIDFQNNKLVEFDALTNETACAIGKICVSTKTAYKNDRLIERQALSEKVEKAIDKIK